jgi:hypothetical protein
VSGDLMFDLARLLVRRAVDGWDFLAQLREKEG